jgi:hypothetical protein
MGKCRFLAAAIVVLGVASGPARAAPPLPPPGPFESATPISREQQIDQLVFARLQKSGIQPAYLCSDAVFVRRAYLDVIGTLPTGPEAAEFIRDQSPYKRRVLIDKLLERDEFVEYWAMKWSDLLRVKAEFPINLWPNGVQAYYRYIHQSIKENKPYDQFARELLTSSGSNFRAPAVNFYRAMQNREPAGIAQTVALTFMGVRAEAWPKEQLAGMGEFFVQLGFKPTGEWKEEIIHYDPTKTKGELPKAIFPDGTPAKLGPGQDPREVFADWLITDKNPWFTKAIANRTWSWFLGRGIIHEPDDIRPDNAAVNPELLAYLQRELVAHHYDLKYLFRVILNSKTYQLASIPHSTDPTAEANFAYYAPRRIEAEVLIDALDQITGTTEKYQSPIPEPFTFIPEDQRSIQLADGSTTSSFLELFGRPSRDTGLEGERTGKPSADQRLHLLNSSHVQKKLEQGPKMQEMMKSKLSPRDTVNALYLTILSRYPTEEEWKAIAAHSQAGIKGRDAFLDLAWALINTAEFQYRH